MRGRVNREREQGTVLRSQIGNREPSPVPFPFLVFGLCGNFAPQAVLKIQIVPGS